MQGDLATSYVVIDPFSKHSVSMISFVHRPSHRPVFDHFTVCKKQRGRLGSFYHVNDICVYLGKKGGEGLSNKRACFTYTFFVLNKECYVFHFSNI